MERGTGRMAGEEKREEALPISGATRRNWQRLHTDGSGRLTRRANKKNSRKKILPAEYCTHPESRLFVRWVGEQAEAHGWETVPVLWTLGRRLLERKGLLEQPHVQAVLDRYPAQPVPALAGEDPAAPALPEDEWDLLGLVYQSLLPEGEKNRAGSYYTPQPLARELVGDMDFSRGQTFLDPCCGSGAFLLATEVPSPRQLFGVDRDPVAVMLAEINLLLQYPREVFVPQVLCLDYLQGEGREMEEGKGKNGEGWPRQFDWIATNPPWGAATENSLSAHGAAAGEREDTGSRGEIRESFALFFLRAWEQLRDGGGIRFLFPDSLRNVRAHRRFREFLLQHCQMEKITRYDNLFSGVATSCLALACRKAPPQRTLVLEAEGSRRELPVSAFTLTGNHVFCFPRPEEEQMLRRIRELGRYDLSGSRWALGLVTGNNRKLLQETWEEGREPIYTGREVERYVLRPPRKFLRYDRARLQQAAPEEVYRAPEKLVYKFISRRLVFACDRSGSLLLNSANLLLPRVPGMGTLAVLAFFNSDVFQFFYRQLFGEVKVLKGNLLELRFPEIGETDNARLEAWVEGILAGDSQLDSAVQEWICGFYGFSERQVRLLRPEGS